MDIARILFPSPLLVLPVPHLRFIKVDLAQIVQQAADRNAFERRHGEFFIEFCLLVTQVFQPVPHIQAVLQQAALLCKVVFCACRRREEI